MGVFRSPRFDDVYRAPSYRAWLGASGYEEGDRFLARFLRHLQGRGDGPRRWILKSPEHVFSFEALTRVFPDAMLVLVHRDPGHVLVSARLTELLRAPFHDVARTPNGGYGANRYQPEEFGIDPERERVCATAYVQRFGIASQLVEVSVLREEHGFSPGCCGGRRSARRPRAGAMV